MNRFLTSIGFSLLLTLPASAGRVDLPEAGASVWLPSGWRAQNLETTDSSRLYMIDDTLLSATGLQARHGGVIMLQAKSGVYTSGLSTHDWVQSEGDGWAYMIEYSSLLGALLVNDSTYWDGLYAREVYGMYRNSLTDSATTMMVRSTAQGDLGWEAWFQADTADADTAVRTYAALLDSIHLDTSLSVLPATGIEIRSSVRATGRNLLTSAGDALRIASRTQPQVDVFDVQGHPVSGVLAARMDGFWYWTPTSRSRSGLLVARARVDGVSSTQRLVLKP